MKTASKKVMMTIDIVILIALVMAFILTSELTKYKLIKNSTEAVTVEDGVASGTVKHNLIVSKSGKYQFFANWWPDEDLGFITAVSLKDMNGTVLFWSTGNKLEVWSNTFDLDKGTYEVELSFFGNDEDFKGFIIQNGTEITDWEETDCFKDGAWNVKFEYGIVGDSTIGSIIAFIIIVAGALCAAHFVILISSTDGKSKAEYDERQILVRGQAYASSTMTMISYFCIYLLLRLLEIKLPVSDDVIIFTGIAIGILVLVTICVWKNAYIAINKNIKRVVLSFSVIALCNAYAAYVNLTRGFSSAEDTSISSNIFLNVGIINLILVLVMLYVIILSLVRMYLDNREEA